MSQTGYQGATPPPQANGNAKFSLATDGQATAATRIKRGK
jgi:hypothetical protein